MTDVSLPSFISFVQKQYDHSNVISHGGVGICGIRGTRGTWDMGSLDVESSFSTFQVDPQAPLGGSQLCNAYRS